MPPKKNKKKSHLNPGRGFATTSVPSKARSAPETSIDLKEDEVENSQLRPQEIPPSEEEKHTEQERELQKELSENVLIVESGLKTYNRYAAEVEVDNRSRKTCIEVSLPEGITEKLLSIAGVCRPEASSNASALDQLKALYAGELLLRDTGLSETITRDILVNVRSTATPEALLQHVALFTCENIYYDRRQSASKDNCCENGLAASPKVQPVEKHSRMSDLLSDEEDQDLIENDPNVCFVANQIALLKLRARAKKDPSVQPSITRLLKRSAVIEAQFGFNRETTSADVKRLVQDGCLAEPLNGIELRSASRSQDDSNGSQAHSPHDSTTIPQSVDSNTTNSTPADETHDDTGSEISTAQVEEDEDALICSNLFDSVSPDASLSAQPKADMLEATAPFPLVLPKSSQNISPVKLLQTFMKRADKQATDNYDRDSETLTLRFSSAKISRRKVVIESLNFRFPDPDTARNYLSMKALFSIPELGSDKAGTRFSGPFREAWRMLEDEEEQVQKALVASKVRNVRRIQESRDSTVVHTQDDPLQSLTSGVAGTVPSGRHNFKDSSMQNVLELWQNIRKCNQYAHMLTYRDTLPIAAYREALLSAIAQNQVTILCGETGCGKSTQLPTFILEDAMSRSETCKIYVTEPRRISAISLATRVSAELGESKKAIASGESLLGFSIRLDSQVSDKSRLIYATTGIVLRMLEDNSDLQGITHLVLDEVHERSIESDFLLIVVKRLLRTRRSLRVVLMSATLDPDRFNNYFGGHCCIFSVPGRTFPVDQYFLEDAIEQSGYVCEDNSFYAKRGSTMNLNTSWELPEEQEDDDINDENLVTYSDRTTRALKILDPYKVNYDLICLLLETLESGIARSMTKAVLIFLPGMGEIRRLLETLQAHKNFGNDRQWLIYPLHSSISNDKQQAAFEVPPRGVRKIVIATNIAETGITIPDITCVIDAGKHKESRFDARRQLNKLVETFISKANARQRMGRAGRVQPGICFHLFSKARFDKMAENQLPEFQRLNLDELALRVKTVQMGGIEDVLLEALDAPTPENVRRSINNLIEVGALDNNQNLTPLGKQIAKIPVDITLGKLILYGVRYACLDPCLVIAAALSSKSPFDTPLGREREASSAKQMFVRGHSDFLTLWTAYSKWRAVCEANPHHEYKFCKDSFLNAKNLAAIEELRLQYLKTLVDSRLLTASDSERHAIHRARFSSSRDGFVTLPRHLCKHEGTPTFIELCLASAFYPNLINVEEGYRTISKGQAVTIHPSSINRADQNFAKRWITFFGLLKTKVATFAHDTGLVDDYIVALFCGSTVEIRPYSGIISLDRGRIKFVTRDLRTLMAINVLRENLALQFANFLDRQQVTGQWLDILQEVIQSFESVAKQKLR